MFGQVVFRGGVRPGVALRALCGVAAVAAWTHLLDEELAKRAVRVVGHGEVECAVAVRVLVVDVGAPGQHQLHELSVAVLRADEQQGVALVVLAVDWEVGVERILEPAQPRAGCRPSRSTATRRADAPAR